MWLGARGPREAGGGGAGSQEVCHPRGGPAHPSQRLENLQVCHCYYRFVIVIIDLSLLLQVCHFYYRLSLLLQICHCYYRFVIVIKGLSLLLKVCHCYYRFVIVIIGLSLLLQVCHFYYRLSLLLQICHFYYKFVIVIYYFLTGKAPLKGALIFSLGIHFYTKDYLVD